ncbi:hypothetical protein SAMN05660691_01680 [Rheinheimera pacifica]|uniref:Uncharacterized protein n=1 Tax=Rheinheimera pacifica TaxID=173990 RepID=A0A1H6L5D3_9GAMM|nr:hypothetical protein [Rheinheimera pacifica]SEH83671.1 hypothetical protein SAMN05660691_01680 [Rheinheimera pacifica]
MKFTTPLKAAVISTGIIAGALSLALPGWIANHHCQQLAQSAIPCTEVDQQNWLSWFTGKSRSTQFHFVDLLELLSRFAPVQKS